MFSIKFMTVNQRVSGSSPEGGATLDKPSEMMAFSLSISVLEVLYLICSSNLVISLLKIIKRI